MKKHYGEYKSTTTSQTGCLKQFVTSATDSILFPPQVSYPCSLCKKSHGFGLVKTWILYSDSQFKGFEKYCVDHGIETEVKL